jgi:hypothetical protein
MSKRASGKHERRDRDFYATTPVKPVLALLPHLPGAVSFCEPCAGDGRLIRHLQKAGHVCTDAFDIQPQRHPIRTGDARTARVASSARLIITNPPWERDTLHRIIRNLAAQRPTWLLLEADWAFTQQAVPFGPHCRKIVSVGRVRWLEGTPEDQGADGFDNAAWYLFDSRSRGRTEFVWRRG